MIKIIVITLVAIIFPACPCIGGGPSPATEPAEPLPGSKISLVDAVKQSDLIFRGVLVKIDLGQPGGPGEASYTCVVNRVGDTLKGQQDAKGIKISIEVWDLEPMREAPPAIKSSYIFFVVKYPGIELSALKLLPDDEKDLHAVRSAMALEKAAAATRR